MKKNIKPIVIKFGGEIAESPSQLENLVHSVSELKKRGEYVILVHGGGPLATRLGKQMGVEAKMVGGRRVTCKETLEIMKMVLPGVTNCDVLAKCKALSMNACSVNSVSFIEAKLRPPKAVSGSNGELVDFGFVGDVVSVDPSILWTLLEANVTPVVSPLCCDKNGQVLNINADTVSAKIAGSVEAKSFVAITAVGGVFKDINDKSSKFTALKMSEAKKLIADGVIVGGMIPKVEEGFALLEKGLNNFHIAAPDTKESIQKEIENPGSIGTAILRD